MKTGKTIYFNAHHIQGDERTGMELFYGFEDGSRLFILCDAPTPLEADREFFGDFGLIHQSDAYRAFTLNVNRGEQENSDGYYQIKVAIEFVPDGDGTDDLDK